MSASINDIFRPDELRAARTTVYAEELRLLKAGSKRAPSPVERVALAELEQTLRLQFAALLAAGKVNELPEGVAA